MPESSTPFTAKAIAATLIRSNPDIEQACKRASDLVAAYGDPKKRLDAASKLLPPLFELLPDVPAAAWPLASFAERLTNSAAYPEALACIDAIIDLPANEPLGHVSVPWTWESEEPFTWPRQQAWLSLLRGACRFALGDREGGEAAIAEGARRAEASNMPPVFSFTGARGSDMGTVADFRLYALVRGARALRRRFEGLDPSFYRKPPKAKKNAVPDRGLLTLARSYLDDVLAVVGPRAAKEFAGLQPQAEGEAPGATRAHRRFSWAGDAYFESGLVDEHLGDITRARRHLGHAKWISAVFNPTHRHETQLLETVERLGLENVAP